MTRSFSALEMNQLSPINWSCLTLVAWPVNFYIHFKSTCISYQRAVLAQDVDMATSPTYLYHCIVIEIPQLYSSPSTEEEGSIAMATHTLHRMTISLPFATAIDYIKYHPYNIMRDILSLVSCSNIPFHYVLIAGAGIDYFITAPPINACHRIGMRWTLHEKENQVYVVKLSTYQQPSIWRTSVASLSPFVRSHMITSEATPTASRLCSAVVVADFRLFRLCCRQ